MISHDKRMLRTEIEALKPGDKVFIFYAKDNNPEYVRSDFEHVVLEPGKDDKLNEGAFLTSGGDTVWDWEMSDYDEHVLAIDTGRGYAYFCKTASDIVRLPTQDDIEQIGAALTAVEGVANVAISVVMHVTTDVPRVDAQRRVHKAEAKIMKACPHLLFDFSTRVRSHRD